MVLVFTIEVVQVVSSVKMVQFLSTLETVF